MANLVRKINSKLDDVVNAYQFYQITRYLTSVIISVIMVRSGLSKDGLGSYELLIFITSSLSYFWSTGIKNAMISFYPTVDDKLRFIHTVLVLLVLLGISTGIIIFLFPQFISYLFTEDESIHHLGVAAVYLALASPLMMIENVLLIRRNSSELKYYALWNPALTLLIVITIAFLNPSVKAFLLGIIIVSVVKLIYLTYIVELHKFKTWNNEIARTFLLFSIPLILNMALGSAMDFVDGWFVSKYFDSGTFAIFRYGSRELPLSAVLYSSLSAAMIPLLMNGRIKSDELKIRATLLMHYLFPVSIVLILASPYIFSVIYSPEFRTSAFIFNIYLLILTSRVLIPQAYNLALHQHKIIIWSGIAELICNIILSYWWMQRWGIYGLAFATMFSYFIQKIILILFNKRKNDIPFSAYINLKYYFAYCIVSILAVCFTFKFL